MQFNSALKISQTFSFKKFSFKKISLIATLCLLNACSTYDNTTRKLVSNITPYRIDIIEGNLITKEMANDIKIGMSAQAVVDRLGIPLLNSRLTPQRLDYVFSYKKGFKPLIEQSRISIFLDKQGLVEKIDTENLLTEAEVIQKIDKR